MTARPTYTSGHIDETERKRRIAQLLTLGRIAAASEIPDHAIPIDPLKMKGGWDPPIFLEDKPFTCRDCGRHQVWKAEDQRWYYEETQAPYFMDSIRCRKCRKAEKPNKAIEGNGE